MRVLSICHDHPDFTAGGTEFAAHDLTRALNAMSGVEARFLAATSALTHPDAEPGSLQALEEDYLLRTGRYDMFSMRRQDGTGWIATLERLLDAFEPQVIHLHGLDRIGAEILPVLRRLRPSLRLFLTLHDYQLICPNDGLLLRRGTGGLCRKPTADSCRQCFPELAAGRHALRKAHLMQLLALVDGFLVPSNAACARFVDWGLEPGRITVLPNAVPEHAPAEPEQDRPRRDRFACFGNMARHKGIHVLLDAAARLNGNPGGFSITLHGQLNHPSDAASEAFEAALNETRMMVAHLGPYHRSEVSGLMAEADWVVVPSVWDEVAPLVVLEAQRARRPVICSGIGGLAEMVRHGIDGLHVPRGNAAALARTMQDAAARPELWDKLVANIPEPLTPAALAEKHLAIYAAQPEPVAA